MVMVIWSCRNSRVTLIQNIVLSGEIGVHHWSATSHLDICQEAEVMQDISTTRQLVQTDSLMWVTLTIEKYRWDGIKADKSNYNMKGHWSEFQCWNYQLNRSKNSLKDQQPRKNIAITKIHTLVLKILKKHEKKEKNKDYSMGASEKLSMLYR